MDLTPELLLEAKFAPARRGYDMNEVDDFLERCAEGLDVLLARLKAEFDRAERAEEAITELRAQLAQGGSGEATAPAEPPIAVVERDEPVAPADEAPAPVAEPVSEPDVQPAVAEPASEPSVEEPMRILIAAERTAEAAIADARAEAERIRAEAESIASTRRSEAEALLARSRADAEAEARRAGEEARRSIEAEVLSLREDREALTHDVRALRRWLDEQRSRMRTTARDLQRLIDDPAALRELPVPELSEDSTDQDASIGPEVDASAEGPDTASDAAADVGSDTASESIAPDTHDATVVGGDRPPTIFDDEGEPTQAVPAADTIRVFDDEADDQLDSSFSPFASNNSDVAH